MSMQNFTKNDCKTVVNDNILHAEMKSDLIKRQFT